MNIDLAEEPVMELHTLECQRCGHSWVPRKTEVLSCPNCKSRVWNQPKEGSQDKETIAQESGKGSRIDDVSV